MLQARHTRRSSTRLATPAAVLLLLGAGLLAAPGARGAALDLEALEIGGVKLGMTSEEAVAALGASGFRESEQRPGRYVIETDSERKRLYFRVVPDAEGTPRVWDIYLSEFLALEGFDEQAVAAASIERFGAPDDRRSDGRKQVLTYKALADAPGVVKVAVQCEREVRERQPELERAESRKRALSIVTYRVVNEQVAAECPSAAELYAQFSDGIEAPRLEVSVTPKRNWGQVDTRLTWTRPKSEDARRQAAAAPGDTATAP